MKLGIVTATTTNDTDGKVVEVTYRWDPPDASIAQITREAFDVLAKDAGWREQP